MKVVGYTYDAAVHCPECARRYVAGRIGDNPQYPLDNGEPTKDELIADILEGLLEFGDSEGNPIHPVFDTDEAGDTPEHCDDCGAYIDTSWHSETVSYAIGELAQYVEDTMSGVIDRSKSEVLDIWNEHLQWCGVDIRDRLIMDLYATTRQKEVEYDLL